MSPPSHGYYKLLIKQIKRYQFLLWDRELDHSEKIRFLSHLHKRSKGGGGRWIS